MSIRFFVMFKLNVPVKIEPRMSHSDNTHPSIDKKNLNNSPRGENKHNVDTHSVVKMKWLSKYTTITL